jgi:hypothetical protein
MNNQPQILPPVVSYILTRRLPCAGLALLMFASLLWLPAGLQQIPLLGLLLSLLVLTVHLLTPGLFALVTFGGGPSYAVQVAGISALVIATLSGLNFLAGLIFMGLYGLMPIMTAWSLPKPGGLRRSAQYLALGLALAMLAAVVFGAAMREVELRAFVDLLLDPMFKAMSDQVQQEGQQAQQILAEIRTLTSWILPGSMALGLWLIWWCNALLARLVAARFGFYRGELAGVLNIGFGKPVAWLFMLTLALANLASGPVQYLAVNAAIMLAGLLMVQGVAVAHIWLQRRQLQLLIVMMYVLLLIWWPIVLPFVMIGLLDIWFDYRRNIPPASGG